MTGTELDRVIAAWLEDAAPRRAPDDLMRAIDTEVQRQRPKPGWLALLTERSMRRAGQVIAGSPTARFVYFAALALLLAAIVGAAIGVGSRLLPSNPLPPPFGPAANGLIAYDTNAAIFVANRDGQHPRAIVGDMTSAASATFSPDGTRIAFWAVRPENEAPDLYVINADGSGRVRVAEEVWTPDDEPPSWSPDGRALVFTSESGKSRNDERLFIVNADGSGRIQIGRDDLRDPARHLLPTWSPDNRWISFQLIRGSMPSGQSELWVIRTDGSDEHKLATVGRSFWKPGPQWEPTPSRARLVYAGDEFGMNGGIFVYDVDTDVKTVVSAGDGVEAGPSWSPDGKRIAWFVTDSSPRNWDAEPTLPTDRIKIANPDGSGVFTIAARGMAGQPAWSPDGTMIVGRSADKASVVVLSVDGSREPIVIFHEKGQGMPTWQRVAP